MIPNHCPLRLVATLLVCLFLPVSHAACLNPVSSPQIHWQGVFGVNSNIIGYGLTALDACQDYASKFKAASGTPMTLTGIVKDDLTCPTTTGNGPPSAKLFAFCPQGTTLCTEQDTLACSRDGPIWQTQSCPADLAGTRPPVVGNPINSATGNKIHIETDYIGPGAFPLQFQRYYNSQDAYGTSKAADLLGEDEPMGKLVAIGAHYNTAAAPAGWMNVDPCGKISSFAACNSLLQTALKAYVTKGNDSKDRYLIEFSSPWRHTYQRTLREDHINGRRQITLHRHDGNLLYFSGSSPTTLSAYSPHTGSLTACSDNTCSYRYSDPDGYSEDYDSDGRMIIWRDPAGLTHKLEHQYITVLLQSGITWSKTCLHKVSTPSSSLTLSCDAASGMINTLTLPTVAGSTPTTLNYTWAGAILGRVDYPKGGSSGVDSRRYHYDDPRYPWALTGITDERGIRTHTWAYAGDGRATYSSHAGVDSYHLNYGANSSPIQPNTLDINDGLGAGTSLTFGNHPVSRAPVVVSSRTQSADRSLQLTSQASYSQSSLGLSGSLTDQAGLNYQHSYDNQNRLSSITTAQQRTDSISYHPSLNWPTRLSDGGLTVTWDWNNYLGKTGDKTITRRRSAENLAWTDTISLNAVDATSNPGQITALSSSLSSSGTGPQVGSPNQASYHYSYAQDRLTTLSGPVGPHSRTTRLTHRSAEGPDCIAYPDGLRETRRYHPRGWLLQRSIGRGDCGTPPAALPSAEHEHSIRYDYHANGQLAVITQADGAFTSYQYDAASRLTRISNTLGHQLQAGYDAMSNLISLEALDSAGYYHSRSKVRRDSLGRISAELDSNDRDITQYHYTGALLARVSRSDYRRNSQGEIIQSVVFGRDELKRINDITINDPGTQSQVGQYQLSYTPWDGLTRLSQRKNSSEQITTTYSPSGHGYPQAESSPDAGPSQIQALNLYGQVTALSSAYGNHSISHNDLGQRLNHTIQGSDGSSLSHDYSYGPCPGASCDRLTQISRNQGSSRTATRWNYDPLGRIASRTEFDSLSVYYTYGAPGSSAAGHLDTLTLPSRTQIHHDWAAGANVGLSLTFPDGSRQPLIVYSVPEPFGPPMGWLWGNGRYHVRLADGQSRPDTLYAHEQIGKLTWDGADRLTGISSQGTAGFITSQECSYQYDAADRLTHDCGTALAAYDQNGNRSATQPGSNRLADSTISYNAAGDITKIRDLTLEYDLSGRVTALSKNNRTTHYRYNALAERIEKTSADGKTTRFIYSEGGQLLGEYALQADGSHTPLKEYIWYYGLPVAVLDYGSNPSVTGPPTVLLIDPDHLGTPRRLTGLNGVLKGVEVWRWDSDAFGQGQPKSQGTFNLRFPGQYFDEESGLHYNYYRYYDPNSGRYLQADPIGLAGGPNPYAYVGNNPLAWSDPLGLQRGTGSYQHGQSGVSDAFGDFISGLTPAKPFPFGAIEGSIGLGLMTGETITGKSISGRQLSGNELKYRGDWLKTMAGLSALGLVTGRLAMMSRCPTSGKGTSGPSPVDGEMVGLPNANRFYKPGAGMDSGNYISQHSQRHLYNANAKSTKNKTQFGPDMDVFRLRNDTVSNPDSISVNLDHGIVKYSKEYGFNISTPDTPTYSMRVFINLADPGQSTQFPYVPRK